jgi:hypothetical protein
MQVVSKYGLFAKIVFGVGIAFTAAMSVVPLRDLAIAGEWPSFAVVCAFLWWVVGGGLIGLWRFRMTATENLLESRFIRTKTICYDQIKRLHFHWSGKVIVSSSETSIELLGFVTNRDALIRFVIDRVRANPGLRVTGDKGYIRSYMGPDWPN